MSVHTCLPHFLNESKMYTAVMMDSSYQKKMFYMFYFNKAKYYHKYHLVLIPSWCEVVIWDILLLMICPCVCFFLSKYKLSLKSNQTVLKKLWCGTAFKLSNNSKFSELSNRKHMLTTLFAQCVSSMAE